MNGPAEIPENLIAVTGSEPERAHIAWICQWARAHGSDGAGIAAQRLSEGVAHLG